MPSKRWRRNLCHPIHTLLITHCLCSKVLLRIAVHPSTMRLQRVKIVKPLPNWSNKRHMKMSKQKCLSWFRHGHSPFAPTINIRQSKWVSSIEELLSVSIPNVDGRVETADQNDSFSPWFRIQWLFWKRKATNFPSSKKLMQCLHRTRHQHGKTGTCAIDAVSNFHSRNENIIVVIADKSFVHNAQVKLVHYRNLALKRRFVPFSTWIEQPPNAL